MALRGEGIDNSGYIYRKWGMNPMALHCNPIYNSPKFHEFQLMLCMPLCGEWHARIGQNEGRDLPISPESWSENHENSEYFESTNQHKCRA